MNLNVLGMPTLQPLSMVGELARAYVELEKIMIIDHNYADAEKYFTKAVPVLKILSGYHILYIYIIIHGLGWIFLMQGAYQKAKDCFSKAMYDREAAWGVNDVEARQPIQVSSFFGTRRSPSVQGQKIESLPQPVHQAVYLSTYEAFVAAPGNSFEADSEYEDTIFSIKPEFALVLHRFVLQSYTADKNVLLLSRQARILSIGWPRTVWPSSIVDLIHCRPELRVSLTRQDLDMPSALLLSTISPPQLVSCKVVNYSGSSQEWSPIQQFQLGKENL